MGKPIQMAPDAPGASGRWGHIRAMRDNRFGLFAALGQRGDAVAKLRVGGTYLIVNEPAALHELLTEKAKSFEKTTLVRSLLYPLAGRGLFTSEGQLWRTQRKRMAPLFQPTQLASYAEIMRASAAESADALRDGESVDVLSITTQIAMRVAGRALFGVDTLSETDGLGEALTTALAWVDKANPALLAQARLSTALAIAARRGGRFGRAARSASEALLAPLLWPGARSRHLRQAISTIDPRVHEMIEARRASATSPEGSLSNRADLLARLLEPERDAAYAWVDDKQVRDEIVTLFVAGHETTAAALAWALYLLARHPEERARIEAEALALPGDPGHSDLGALPYATRVFKEAMRLYPPIPIFDRQAMENVELAGYDLPAGTVCLVSPYALHRRPDLWPDPERFNPERFLPEQERSRPRYGYLPFSAGPRTCIGNFFALMEGPLVLATLLRRARFDLESPAPAVPVAASTLRPPAIRMRVTKRIPTASGVRQPIAAAPDEPPAT